MRRSAIISVLLVGCSYPDFAFTADSAATTDAALDDDVMVVTDSARDDAPMEVEPGADAAREAASDAALDARDSALDVAADTAEAAVDTGPPVGCAGSTDDFCVDWDAVTTPEAPFTGKGVTPTATLALESSAARSAPNAFVSTAMTSATDTTVLGVVYKTFTLPSLTAPSRFDVWIKLEAAMYSGAPGSAAFLLKLERDGGVGDGVTFSIDDSGFFADRIGLDYGRYDMPSYKPKIGVWMHVRMEARLHTTSGSLKVFIDDMTTPLVDQSMVSTVKVDSLQRLLNVGIYADRATATFRAHYDDLRLSYK